MRCTGFPLNTLILPALIFSLAVQAKAASVAPLNCQRVGSTDRENRIQVSGTLYEEPFLGPPNYGYPKTDTKLHAFILRLDDPLRVMRKGGEFEDPGPLVVKEIQLLGDFPGKELYQKHVIAAGGLFSQVLPWHRRAIVLFMNGRVRPGGRIGCDGSEQPLN
jgi:hypothetical protein